MFRIIWFSTLDNTFLSCFPSLPQVSEIISKVSLSQCSIISNGLLLNLDAGDTASYSGTGTNWIDLSGMNNNAVLMNGLVFNITDGSMQFDGTNRYARTPINVDTNPILHIYLVH